MKFIRDAQVRVDGGKVPVQVRAGEVFIYCDACTPGVATREGIHGFIASNGGSPVLAVADARDVGK